MKRCTAVRRLGTIAALVPLLSLVYQSVAHAAAQAAAPSPTDQLRAIIGNITAWVVGLLFVVATLFATIAAARFMTAQDPSDVERAKSAFRSAFLGYALALLAPILLAIVRGWLGA
jgi:hypothetical protein